MDNVQIRRDEQTCLHCGESDRCVVNGCCAACARQNEIETAAQEALDILRLASAENFEDTF